MRKISCWAKGHVWTTRLLIILVLYPALNVLGFFAGAFLYENGTSFPAFSGYLITGIFLTALLCYPNRKSSYYRRKSLDLTLALCTLGFLMLTGNRYQSENPAAATVLQGYASTITTDPPSKSSIKKEKKTLKQLIRKLHKKYKAASPAEKVVLIVLAVILLVFLVFGLGILACNIACAGSEALAYVVLAAGLTGLIFLFVRVIRGIKRKYQDK